MLKKFNSLGTAISRKEAKMIVGGYGIYELQVALIDDSGASCTSDCSLGNGKSITCEGVGDCVATGLGCQVTGQPEKKCAA